MNINWDNWLRYFSGQPYQCSCSDLPPHPTVLAAVDAGAITMAEDAMCAPADTSW
jgi:hypothetical protein